ncbi:MAG: hypothetical protein KDK65_05555, partial [Chlamydiia bacterium]|nr:hypothetical protein [Chlamydiia bacterium]
AYRIFFSDGRVASRACEAWDPAGAEKDAHFFPALGQQGEEYSQDGERDIFQLWEGCIGVRPDTN